MSEAQVTMSEELVDVEVIRAFVRGGTYKPGDTLRLDQATATKWEGLGLVRQAAQDGPGRDETPGEGDGKAPAAPPQDKALRAPRERK